MSPPPRFDVVGLGAVAVDDLLYVDEYPPPESKVRVRRRQRQCGGLTGTALVAAARLGCRCAYAGVLGNDELSRFVIDALTREGISLDYRVERDEARPAHSTILVDQRRNTRTVFASIDGLLGADPLRPEAALIGSAGALLVDHHGLEGTVRAAAIAREAGVGVVADLERDPGGPFAELLAMVDHLIVSRRFAQALSGQEDAARAAEALWTADRRAVVVTGGADGCWYLGDGSGRSARHLPAMRVDVVDTTGCGDVFHGAYAAVLARGGDLENRLIVATAAAALKATRHGGQAGCPTGQEVGEFLRQRGVFVKGSPIVGGDSCRR